LSESCGRLSRMMRLISAEVSCTFCWFFCCALMSSSHTVLCPPSFQCFIWHACPQFDKDLQRPHLKSRALSVLVTPQHAPFPMGTEVSVAEGRSTRHKGHTFCSPNDCKSFMHTGQIWSLSPTCPSATTFSSLPLLARSAL